MKLQYVHLKKWFIKKLMFIKKKKRQHFWTPLNSLMYFQQSLNFSEMSKMFLCWKKCICVHYISQCYGKILSSNNFFFFKCSKKQKSFCELEKWNYMVVSVRGRAGKHSKIFKECLDFSGSPTFNSGNKTHPWDSRYIL